MKFVYFGYDFMIHAAHRLMDVGHKIAAIFTFECDNVFNFNVQTLALAEELGLNVQSHAPTADDIQKLADDGVTGFLAAGYPFKIPPLPDNVFGLNVHPAYLPKGRGIMPTPYIIMGAQDAAGVTIHKLTDSFDAGDILAQKKFNLSPHESVETYAARAALAVPEMLAEIFKDLPAAWDKAKPQENKEASSFPLPPESMRLLDFTKTVEEIDQTARAFGRFGVIAHFGNEDWVVYQLGIWQEAHKHDSGSVAWAGAGREAVIAAKDGFVCLKDFHLLEPLPEQVT